MLNVISQFLTAVSSLQANQFALLVLVAISAFAVVGLALMVVLAALRRSK